MQQEQLLGLHQDLLAILLDIQQVCDRHNISFYLGEGSLLGAVRHQGFIPWDDDIDILMKRPDYERFLKIAPEELKDRCLVQHPSTVYPYWSTFIKVRANDPHPRFYQEHIRHLTPYCGPCVDIFPLEYVEKADSVGQRLQFAQIRLYRRMIGYKLGVWHPFNLKTRIIKLMSYAFPFDWLQEHTAREMRRQGDGEKPYIAAFPHAGAEGLRRTADQNLRRLAPHPRREGAQQGQASLCERVARFTTLNRHRRQQ